ncbi:MAG: NAD(P)H-hydrate dehydratase [Candidatus Marinimicrobia bacterium]|nr:NAD(P)H-hydrate dehydratase [Candidatus Neomarinimicrobiota bacterium]
MREYVLSNEEAKIVDSFTIEKLGISGKKLMNRAGKAVATKVKEILKDIPGSRVDIFCGTGNNGGDGFVCGLNLYDWGAIVYIWVVGNKEKIKGDAKYYFDKCLESGLNINYIEKVEDVGKIHNIIETDLIVDAIFGTGFKGNVKPPIDRIIEIINNSTRPVISVDIPSGVNGDSGIVHDIAVKANATVTMGFLKRGLLLYPGKRYAGEVTVADIGYNEQSFNVLKNKTYLIHKEEIVDLIPPLYWDTYKHRQGKVLVFAGSVGMTGAAVLTCEAAMRTGAGLVVLSIPKSLNDIVEIKLTEVLSMPVNESEKQTFTVDSLTDNVRERIKWSDVIVFGPGVSYCEHVIVFGENLLKSVNKPVVIDADGLKIFKNNTELIKKVKEIVLTPHYGEFSLITGIPLDEIKMNVVDIGREFAISNGCVLVLKGAPTLVFNQEGDVVFNSTGNPGLATGGTGDVLTGMIASLIAQGMSVWDAAISAVFIHGYTADIIAMESSMRGLVAGDIIKKLPVILKEFERVE